MVGHVGPTEAIIWAHHPSASGLRVFYREAGAPIGEARVARTSTAANGPRMARARLTGLEPDTDYVYRVAVGQGRSPRHRGSFRTPPRKGTPSRFTMATASCMKPKVLPHTWHVLLEQKPVFQLLLGDNVYADTTKRSRLWKAYLDMRNVEAFRVAIGRAATYAVWDDHDFAGDNADGTEPGKAEALRTFKEVWANPSFGAPGVPGTFFDFSWGDVDFFVLDGRYHRSPVKARNDHRKRMLGDAQFRWLLQRLAASKATFKVLASGSTMKDKPDDSWAHYDFSRRRLFKAIADRRIEGVLYLSGDLHRSEIRVHPAAETGFYDLVEVISSGIQRDYEGSFATLTFDTTAEDPSVEVRVFLRDGSVKAERTFRCSQMRMTASEAAVK